jgi:rRNA maturation protein Nop10
MESLQSGEGKALKKCHTCGFVTLNDRVHREGGITRRAHRRKKDVRRSAFKQQAECVVFQVW